MAQSRTRFNQNGTVGFWLAVIIVILMAASAAGVYFWQHGKVSDLDKKVADLSSQLQAPKTAASQPAPTTPSSTANDSYTSQKRTKIVVYVPAKDTKVASPLAVIGEVPGNWSFEASFPIQLKDNKGNIVAQATGQLLGDWMTSEMVPFSAKLTYTSAPPGAGTLILQKDNPSGLAQNADSVTIPVRL